MSVNSYYKPPNQAFDFKSSTTDTPLQIIIGDFNSHSTEWGYRSTNDDDTLVEGWCDVNSLIPKPQHRPTAIKIKAVVSPQDSLQKKVQPKESRLGRFSLVCHMGITDIVPTPDNYGSFVDLIKKASIQIIPRGCRTSYICGLTDKSK